MINLSNVAQSQAFAQDYVVMRSASSFVRGGVASDVTEVPMYGIIQPATAEDIAQVPEGDRTTGMMSFIATERMYTTRSKPPAGLADKITWDTDTWKVVATWPWGDFGFWKAVGSRQP